MRERSDLIHSETYAERLDAYTLLSAAVDLNSGDPQELRRIAGALDAASARFVDAQIGVTFSAYADLIRIAAFLVDWRRAVLDAETDSDRFKRSALERLSMWRSEYEKRPGTTDLKTAIETVNDQMTISEVGAFCHTLESAPLPVGFFGDVRRGPTIDPLYAKNQKEDEPLQELNIAFLMFTVDTEPADQIHFLTPHEMHDLEIEVRVSRWPAKATELRLSPVSVEVAGAYNLPEFKFSRPASAPPFTLRQRGRAAIYAAQALRAQPFEFRYAAEFWPKDVEQPVSVVGHRTLLIESVDFQRSPLTHYPSIDRRVIEIRNSLRRLPAIPRVDIESAMSLLVPLAALAARAVQDKLFPLPISEAEFQKSIRDELRRSLGPELEEHPHAGGGITDLSFRGIRLELKVEAEQRLVLADCQQFVPQATAYAVGSGKRLALLCVLDASPKSQEPYSAEEGLGILQSDAQLPIVTTLIQGGLARPSDLT